MQHVLAVNVFISQSYRDRLDVPVSLNFENVGTLSDSRAVFPWKNLRKFTKNLKYRKSSVNPPPPLGGLFISSPF